MDIATFVLEQAIAEKDRQIDELRQKVEKAEREALRYACRDEGQRNYIKNLEDLNARTVYNRPSLFNRILRGALSRQHS